MFLRLLTFKFKYQYLVHLAVMLLTVVSSCQIFLSHDHEGGQSCMLNSEQVTMTNMHDTTAHSWVS